MERVKVSKLKTWQGHINEWTKSYVKESFVSELSKASLPEILATKAISEGKKSLYKFMHPNLVEALNKPAEVFSYKEGEDYGSDKRVLTLSEFWNSYQELLGSYFYAVMRKKGIQDILADAIANDATTRAKTLWETSVDPTTKQNLKQTQVFLPPLK